MPLLFGHEPLVQIGLLSCLTEVSFKYSERLHQCSAIVDALCVHILGIRNVNVRLSDDIVQPRTSANLYFAFFLCSKLNPARASWITPPWLCLANDYQEKGTRIHNPRLWRGAFRFWRRTPCCSVVEPWRELATWGHRRSVEHFGCAGKRSLRLARQTALFNSRDRNGRTRPTDLFCGTPLSKKARCNSQEGWVTHTAHPRGAGFIRRGDPGGNDHEKTGLCPRIGRGEGKECHYV